MKFDIIVIGGGHAGIEASHISAKQGLSVLLITSHLDLIGQMSCNPSIGGIAKGNIVREIDALGGLMARIIDKAGIHFKMLNKTKGMAVWGNRAQADKKQYRSLAKDFLEQQKNVSLMQGFVKKVTVANSAINSVVMDSGEEIFATAVIFCMGTFLNGVAHIGLHSFSSGRIGEPASDELTKSIEQLGIKSGRFKTGTSPRINGKTVNFSLLTEQKGDEYPWPFSFSSQENPKNKTSCWVTKSSKITHKVIKENLNRSPLYTGKIKSSGPRYCPSIEDKVMRFGERDGHTLFLEPEGLDTTEMYLNGLSTSLPFDVQIQMVHSVPGLENAEIVRPGYGIEYDYFPPTQLLSTLESKVVKNLFFAGQINGTSGYEEAGSQGLMAGINAAANIKGQQPLVLSRDSSYTGVLIDDLVTKGTDEPYRMFTSRAEHRLKLRQDTTDERLMPLAVERKLIDKELFENRQKIWKEKKELKTRLFDCKISPEQWNKEITGTEIKVKTKAIELIKRPEVTLSHIAKILQIEIANKEILLGVEADIKYDGFIEKEKDHLERFKKLGEENIPETIDYSFVTGLLIESKTKLIKTKPRTLGEALKIPGLTPADISVLIVHLSKLKHVSRETTG